MDREDDELHPELVVLDVRERMLAVSDIAEVTVTACGLLPSAAMSSMANPESLKREGRGKLQPEFDR